MILVSVTSICHGSWLETQSPGDLRATSFRPRFFPPLCSMDSVLRGVARLLLQLQVLPFNPTMSRERRAS